MQNEVNEWKSIYFKMSPWELETLKKYEKYFKKYFKKGFF